MTADEFAVFVSNQQWKAARNLPNAPHDYIVKTDKNQELFLSAARFIRENGYVTYFWKRRYVYYDHDGYHFWTMGAPLAETTILNRAKIK